MAGWIRAGQAWYLETLYVCIIPCTQYFLHVYILHPGKCTWLDWTLDFGPRRWPDPYHVIGARALHMTSLLFIAIFLTITFWLPSTLEHEDDSICF